MTNPLDMSRKVRSRAWTFSKVRSLRASRGTCARAAWKDSTSSSPQLDAEGSVADLPEGQKRQGLNVDRVGGNAELLHQVECVVPRPGSGAKAGHRQTVNQAPVDIQQVARLDGDKQGEGGVESARDADIQRSVRGKLLDPLGQPRALNAEDLGAATVQFGPFRRHEGRARHESFQARHLRGELEAHSPERLGEPRPLLETRRDPPVRLELGDVHVLGDPVSVTANLLAVSDTGRFRDQPAVLGDQAMTAENQVSRRFRRPGARIRVGGDAPARLPHHQLGPVLALADGFIAGRQVEQDRRAGPRLHRAGGSGTQRSSQISIPTTTGTFFCPSHANSRSIPKGTRPPGNSISEGSEPSAGRNQRLS